MKKRIVIASLLMTVIIAISFFIGMRKVYTKKMLVYSSIESKIDISALSLPPEKSKDKLSTNILYIDSDNYSELDKYGNISNLYISDIDFDMFPALKDKNIYYISVYDCSNFNLSDINCEYLKQLDVINTNILNFDKISLCQNMSSLNLTKTDIGDFSELEKLSSLNSFIVSDVKNENLNFILNNKELNYLSVTDSDISSLDGISELSELETLYVKNCKLSGTVDLSLNNIYYLSLMNNSIDNIVFSDDISRFSFIDLSYNNIKKLDNSLLDKLGDNIIISIYGNNELDCSNLKDYENILKINDNMGRTYTVEEYSNYISELDKMVTDIEAKCDNELEKVVYAYWLLCRHTDYDYEYVNSDIDKNVYDVQHTAYGAMVKRLAVCDGFCYAFNDILKLMGIESYNYHGDLYDTTDDSTHAWNVVKIDGKYYHCDITGGVSTKDLYDSYGDLSYMLNYFGNSDNDMKSKKYFLLDENVPKATESLDKKELEAILTNLI